MPRALIALVFLALAAACAPTTRPPAPPPPVPDTVVAAAPDTVNRHLLRPIPVPAFFRSAVGQGTRTTIGEPGPSYWQQRVRYDIQAEVEPESALLRGLARITYTNHSPDTLASIMLNLYQNVFSEGVPRNRYSPITGGIMLERVAIDGRTIPAREMPVTQDPAAGAQAGYAVRGTLGRVVLPRPLVPGDSTTLEIDWRYTIPPAGTYRTAWQDALGGRAFVVAQWYPQIATYDDLHGWDATPYLGDGEFYLEYGDFDVAITVPAGWLVGATGELRNPSEVLTDEARRRLDLALASDSTTRVVTEADLDAANATLPSESGQLTWRFRATDVRDFAFATSDRYVWDATRATIPSSEGGTRTVVVHALYRPGAPHWERAARFGQHSTEFFSRELIPYLYPQITIAEGPVGGMEYPQIVFIGKPQEVEPLYAVIAHEVLHEWFPMVVGQNEAAYAWMDEGSATFYESLAFNDFFPGSDAFEDVRASYLRVAGTEAEVPLMRHTDLVSPYGARGVAAYTKPGILLRSLRTVVGDSVFDRAMRGYAQSWLLKHPTPWDFFHTFEREAGRDLDWFFYPWWWETGTLDQAVESVEVPDTIGAGDSVSVRITIRDLGEVPAPSFVVATTAAGDTVSTRIPIETWLDDGIRSATVTLPAPGPVVRVELDPEHLFPDVDRENNVWMVASLARTPSHP